MVNHNSTADVGAVEGSAVVLGHAGLHALGRFCDRSRPPRSAGDRTTEGHEKRISIRRCGRLRCGCRRRVILAGVNRLRRCLHPI